MSCYNGAGQVCQRGTLNLVYDGDHSLLDVSNRYTQEERIAGRVFDIRVRSWTDGTFTYDDLAYVHYDPMGSVALLTDMFGTVVETCTSEANGTAASCTVSDGEKNYLAEDSVRYRPSPAIYQLSDGTAFDPQAGEATAFSTVKQCDIYFQQCHDAGRLLPKGDVYIDLLKVSQQLDIYISNSKCREACNRMPGLKPAERKICLALCTRRDGNYCSNLGTLCGHLDRSHDAGDRKAAPVCWKLYDYLCNTPTVPPTKD